MVGALLDERNRFAMTPLLLPTDEGALFLSIYHPSSATSFRGWVVHLPAFAEEMNRSRHMVSSQAQKLASSGFSVVVVDLSCTGDSDGHFADADLTRWRSDALAVLHWVKRQRAQDVTLWGLRFGGLLAAELIEDSPLPVAHLLLWQPVVSGSRVLGQMLRQRVFSAETSEASVGGSSAGVLGRESGAVEIGGYYFSPPLQKQLEEVDLARVQIPQDLPVTWIDVSPAESATLRLEAGERIKAWAEMGIEVDTHLLRGPAFWASQENTVAPLLLDMTLACLSSRSDLLPRTLEQVDFRVENAADRRDEPLVFQSGEEELAGFLAKSESTSRVGVVFLVGGPQYRVGAHRQLVTLAREFAEAGLPSIRFDFAGMGDSTGVWPGFENTGGDIRAAIDVFLRELPDIEHVLLWGLCDAATAACLYANTDKRVSGLVLANPWLFDKKGRARAYVKHYYPARMTSAGFWKDVFSGRMNLRRSLASLWENLGEMFGRYEVKGVADNELGENESLTKLFGQSLNAFSGKTLLLLSENDLTAKEFIEVVSHDDQYSEVLSSTRLTRCDVADADHTFSRAQTHQTLTRETLKFISGNWQAY